MVWHVHCSSTNSHGSFNIHIKGLLVQSQASFSRETEKALCGSFVVEGLQLVLHDKTIENSQLGTDTVSTTCTMWNADLVQNANQEQNADCRLGTKR